MFGVADYGAFVAAIIIFLAIPGPGNLALITSTGKGGIRGGLGATFGVIAGDQVLMWAAVAGVAPLRRVSGTRATAIAAATRSVASCAPVATSDVPASSAATARPRRRVSAPPWEAPAAAA